MGDEDWDNTGFGAPSSGGGSTGFGAPATTNGFGSGGGGGFGSGFGASGDDGWGTSSSSFGGDKPRGGSSGRGCFKCGEEGHMSRECPKGGGGGRGCFKCGEEGHMSRECPKGGGGGGRGCFKCGQEGHMSRDCTEPGRGGGGGSRACHKCGQEGHIARDCPGGGGASNGFSFGSAGGGGGFGDSKPSGFGGFGDSESSGFGGGFGDSKPSGGGSGRGCFKCGEEGHMSRECPQGGGGGGGGRGCFKCGEEGHMSRECPQGGGGGGGGKGCFKCGEEGHMARDCPTAPPSDGPRPEIYVPPPPPEGEEEIFKTLAKGINFDKYDAIPVECTGRGAPRSGISTFEEADLNEVLLDNVRKAHYEKPTPIQRWAIPIISSGRDVMGCAQTGSGKTAAFLLPVLTGILKEGIQSSEFTPVQTPQCLIIGPTRELVVQINQEARKFAYNSMIRPVVVYGGTSVQSQLATLSRGTNVLVGTPGRLIDFLEKGKVSLEKVKYLILDEADRMLDMGFEPTIRKIVGALGLPPKTERQTLMFSATFPEEIQKLAADFLNDYLFVTVGRVGGANTDISQKVYNVGKNDKREKLVSLLREEVTLERTLVFVEQKRSADFLASFLSQSEFATTSIHGDRQQREREEALTDFKAGRAPILVATSVAARGLDIQDVKHVVNFDLPSSIDEYVHRIGRTGRCGNLGKATSFYDPDTDKDLARSLVKILQEAQQVVPDWLDEDAQNQFGSGFAGAGGRFGGKDTRRGGRGGDDEWGDKGGGAPSGGGAVADDEEWD